MFLMKEACKLFSSNASEKWSSLICKIWARFIQFQCKWRTGAQVWKETEVFSGPLYYINRVRILGQAEFWSSHAMHSHLPQHLGHFCLWVKIPRYGSSRVQPRDFHGLMTDHLLCAWSSSQWKVQMRHLSLWAALLIRGQTPTSALPGLCLALSLALSLFLQPGQWPDHEAGAASELLQTWRLSTGWFLCVCLYQATCLVIASTWECPKRPQEHLSQGCHGVVTGWHTSFFWFKWSSPVVDWIAPPPQTHVLKP